MAKILKNEPLGADMRVLVLSAAPAFENGICPGTFAHLKVPGATAHLLRRPISIMDADENEKTLTLAIAPKGEGTRLICALKAGDELEMLAPMGKGFDAKNAKSIWAIGGGAGVAPMLLACKRFSKAARLTAILGFRGRGQMFGEDEFSTVCSELMLCTDDGSAGFHGTVAAAAAARADAPELIIACGPTPMLKSVQKFALENGIPCQLSLEQRMGCGYGACLTCSCKTRRDDGSEGFSRVCADGPVFDAKAVVL